MQWIYSLCLEMVQYIANSLLTVFSMDLDYFFQVAPVAKDILSILIAAGWALLMGNLVFQAVRSMVSGLGFEGEDPKLLFTRTFVFAFLLLASQQICEIGLNISAQIIQMLQIPSSVTVTIPDESNFNIGASWLLIIIVGFVVMWQFVKLCFEVAERYVVTAVLVLMAPLAFGLGGSKSTEDIFKGWCRMFASMCLMMVMNIIFLKLLISAMGYVPSGLGVLPWMLLIVGIARVARKIDSVVARIGLNPAITGDGLGRGLPGMVAFAAIRGLGMAVTRSPVVHTVLLIIIIVMALSALQVPMSSIVATIGAAGLAIGLALQNSLSNVAGGFIILFSKPFKCGDYVKIGDSEGTVDAISILYTTLKTLENKMIFIPNGVVSQSTITNITADDKRRLELKFSISYNDDHNKAMAILREMLNDEPRVINEPDKPLVAVCEHGTSAIILIMRVWIPTDAYWEIRYKFLKEAKERFDANGISIPFDQLDVHISK